jgi:hypothetical protein
VRAPPARAAARDSVPQTANHAINPSAAHLAQFVIVIFSP